MVHDLSFFVGTYSHDLGGMDPQGEGIYACTLNAETGELAVRTCAAACINPSYLAWGANTGHLYATSEVFRDDGPEVLAFEVGEGQALKLLNAQPVDGELPCHLAVDPSGRYLASAQYWSGDALLYPLEEGGKIVRHVAKLQHRGNGPNAKRQEGPHAHFVQFLADPSALAVVDLGIDRIMIYPFDAQSGVLSENEASSIDLPAGAGPRHFALFADGTKMAVFCELNENIYLFERAPSGWAQIQQLRAFEGPEQSNGAGAAIRISQDQRFIYVSGRLQSEIACFEIDQTGGQLSRFQNIATGGEGPRDFSLSRDGRFIVVANQASNNLTSFLRDQETGRLEPTGHSAKIGDPVCVLF